jgi:probable rRNA maturation factor
MTAPDISVRNRQRKIPVNVTDLQIFAAKALRRCLQLRKRKSTDLDQLWAVFVWLISDRRMASLHRKFMHQTGPTDVLTFQHGEIFISVETAKKHARAFGNSLACELCLYITHGLLHLHGFDDRTQAAARKMKAMQKKILRDCSRDR